jgi:hypothetical protein
MATFNRSRHPPHRDPDEWIIDRYHLSASIQGDAFQVKMHFPKQAVSGGGLKKQIYEFSAQSRLNLIHHLHIIYWRRLRYCLFVTLTYPDHQDLIDRESRNKHRAIFARELEKCLGHKVRALWRVEWMPRQSGARAGEYIPHWHLLLLGIPFVHYSVINQCWRKALGNPDAAITDIFGAHGGEAARMYIGKYLSKESYSSYLVTAAYHNTLGGRHWGFLRKSLIPFARRKRIGELTPAQEQACIEFARTKFHSHPDKIRQGWRIFGDGTREIFDKISAENPGESRLDRLI